jgi:glycosyltransferase involved in cell wall biosynthesis
MRIALVYFHALGPGGYPRDVRWLAGALAIHGHQVSLVTRQGDDTDGLADHDVEVVSPATFAEGHLDVDIVHSWGLLLPSQIRAASSARAKGRKILGVISPLAQLMPFHRDRSAWKKVPYLHAVRPMLRKIGTAAHFFSSEEYWASVRYLRPPTWFEANLGVFPPEELSKPKDVGDYLLFFGRNDVTHKGLDVLVEGYRLARREGLDLPLVVAGRPEGNSDKFWQNVLADPELHKHVQVLGDVTDEKRTKLLADARCLVFLSRWDGPPRPIREAIALGTPTIVTNGTNMAGVVEKSDAGISVALAPSSIAAGLQTAADSGTVRRWRRGAEALRDALSWSNVASEYVEGYEATLSGGAEPFGSAPGRGD